MKRIILIALLFFPVLLQAQYRGKYFEARDSITTPVIKLDSIKSDSSIVIVADTVKATNVYFEVGGINVGGGYVTGDQLSDSIQYVLDSSNSYTDIQIQNFSDTLTRGEVSVSQLSDSAQSAILTSNSYTDTELQNFNDTLTRGGLSFDRDSVYNYIIDSSIVNRVELSDSLNLKANLSVSITANLRLDSIEATLDNEVLLRDSVPFLDDSVGGASGNNYYVTPTQVSDTAQSVRDYVDTEIAAIETGGSSTTQFKFIVGDTVNAPTAGDDTLRNTSFYGKHIEVYRDSAKYPGLMRDYFVTLVDSTITVSYNWVTGEKVVIDVTNNTAWSIGALSDTATPLGANVVLNGTFDSDLTSWSTSATFIWESPGHALHNAADAGSLYQTDILDPTGNGVTQWSTSFTVGGMTTGSVQIRLGTTGGDGISRTSNGTYAETITQGSNDNLYITVSTDFDGWVDDISAQEIP